ncbi:MAG: hypothetical protein ACOVQN_12970, partial [Exiguobacterium sp.]
PHKVRSYAVAFYFAVRAHVIGVADTTAIFAATVRATLNASAGVARLAFSARVAQRTLAHRHASVFTRQ